MMDYFKMYITLDGFIELKDKSHLDPKHLELTFCANCIKVLKCLG